MINSLDNNEVAENKSEITKATIVQFSGGLDSTYIVHSIMSGKINCDLDSLYFVYVQSGNVDSKQQECEIDMMKKSIEYLKNKYELNFDINNRLLIFENNMNGNLPMNKYGYGSQGVLWVSMIFQILSICKIDEIDIYNGNILSDSYQSHLNHIKELEDYIYKITDYNTKCNVIAPLSKYNKHEVLYNLITEDIELLKYVHFCEVILHELSNVCPSCDTFYKAVIELIEFERRSKEFIKNISKYLMRFKVVITIENNNDIIIRTPIMYGKTEGEYKETRLIKYFRLPNEDILSSEDACC